MFNYCISSGAAEHYFEWDKQTTAGAELLAMGLASDDEKITEWVRQYYMSANKNISKVSTNRITVSLVFWLRLSRWSLKEKSINKLMIKAVDWILKKKISAEDILNPDGGFVRFVLGAGKPEMNVANIFDSLVFAPDIGVKKFIGKSL